MLSCNMVSMRVNGVDLGAESFGRDEDPLLLLVGGTTMLSWPDSLCERLAAAGRRVVRYDLRDSGGSTTRDPENPTYDLRDLAEDAAGLVSALGAQTAHLGGIGVGGHGRSSRRARPPAVDFSADADEHPTCCTWSS